MNTSTRDIALALLACGLSAITAAAVTNTTADAAVRLGYQTSEQKINGAKITEWSAPLVGLEGRLGSSLTEMVRLEGRGVFDVLFDEGKLYTSPGSGAFIDYTARQLRIKGEGAAGLVLGNSNLSLMPFAGVGLRLWSWSTPDPDFLHIESWSAVYGLVGLQGDARIGSVKAFGRVDIQLPVKETLTAEGSERNFDPSSTRMVEAELGLVVGKLMVGLWGEWFTYSSDNLPSENYYSGFAEDIDLTTIGLKIGARF